MANLTITIDDQTLRRARVRAVEQGTSVNRILADYLRQYAGSSGQADAIARFFELADQAQFTSAPDGRTWSREDLHDRAALRD